MFKPRPIATLVAARLKERITKAEAAHAEGSQLIERERFDALARVHEDHDAKQNDLVNQLVESIIGPEPKV